MILRPRLVENAQFPDRLVTVDGEEVDIKQIVRTRLVIVVTLKAVWCPVCPMLLKLIEFHGLGQRGSYDGVYPLQFQDPISRITYHIGSYSEHEELREILNHDVFFITICPGSDDQVRQLRDRVRWKYPMIADDRGICRSLGLAAPEMGGVWPAILAVADDGRVEALMIGRSGGNYGEDILFAYLQNQRRTVEQEAASLVDHCAERVLPTLREWIEPDRGVTCRTFLELPTEMITKILDELSVRDLVVLCECSINTRIHASSHLFKRLTRALESLANKNSSSISRKRGLAIIKREFHSLLKLNQ